MLKIKRKLIQLLRLKKQVKPQLQRLNNLNLVRMNKEALPQVENLVARQVENQAMSPVRNQVALRVENHQAHPRPHLKSPLYQEMPLLPQVNHLQI